MTKSRLDVASGSINLVSAVLNSAGSVGSAGKELFKWLGREGLSEEQFVYTMGLAQDLSAPNIHGQSLLDSLDVTASRLYGLQLVMPGALGRAIQKDPQLCWMATTVAALLKYNNLVDVTRLLVDLIVSQAIGPDDYRAPAYTLRVSPVIKKSVESIALHTTNLPMGRQMDLPDELRGLARHYVRDSVLVGGD